MVPGERWTKKPSDSHGTTVPAAGRPAHAGAGQSQHPVNLRDKNMTDIAQCLQKEVDIHVYSDTVGYELYEYQNLPLYRQGIKVYEEINRLIGLKVLCTDEGSLV